MEPPCRRTPWLSFFVIFAICADDFSSLLRHFDGYAYEEVASGFGLLYRRDCLGDLL
jgi:hypothetical protein